MWANRAWIGRYVPGSTPAGEELRAYAGVLNAVEGNTTFYATPGPEAVARWADSVPPDFRFMFKLPRTITHERRLRDCIPEVHGFLDALEPLAPWMEPISIQLPASFDPGSLAVLERFLGDLPTAFRWAVEVRHPGFCDGDRDERRLNDLLCAQGADRIILDSRALFAGAMDTREERDTFTSKPRLPVRAVATVSYTHLRAHETF